MSQILHIFRKDVRHHWIEILLCQAALVAYCWNEVRSWSERGFAGDSLAQFIIVLVPLTWSWFLFRVVQDESLVGDRQFWVTRPYEWKKLLAEKVLLLLVFINLPLLIAGAILLAKAGFAPAPFVLGLLWMQLLLLQLPFLPLLALASVTRNLTQGFLTLLAVWLFIVGIVVVPGFFRIAGSHYTTLAFGSPIVVPRYSNDIEGLVMMLVCVAAVGLQYARRKTAQSRLWLVGGVFAAVLIAFVSAYAKRNKDPFPVPTRSTIAFHAGLDPVKLLAPKVPAEQGEVVPIGIPVTAGGLLPNTLGQIRGMRVVLEGPGGLRWDGRWQGSMQLLGPQDSRWRALYQMDYETYQRMKSAPLKAHVSLSVDVFREHEFETISATGGDFAVPRVGRCRVWGMGGYMVRCISPLVRPEMVVLRVDPALSTCPDQDTGLARPGYEPIYGLPYSSLPGRRSELPQGGISPVVASIFYFWEFNDRVQICPGTPLNFSFPQFVENVRSDFEIENVHLDDYRLPRFQGSPMRAADGTQLGLPPAH
jgi:hypothetical protein